VTKKTSIVALTPSVLDLEAGRVRSGSSCRFSRPPQPRRNFVASPLQPLRDQQRQDLEGPRRAQVRLLRDRDQPTGWNLD
jgi:hypothetical protein